MLKNRYIHFIQSFFILVCLWCSIASAATTPAVTPGATPSTSAAPAIAGQVIITSGSFSALDINKHTRILVRGANFFNGDTLITGPNSKAQVRYTDGTVLALDPDSEFKIANYHFQQPNQKDLNISRLIKGGFRALTGLISKNDPSAYQVDTTVAAIAVRGTSYGASFRAGKLYIGVWKGSIVIENSAGSILLGAGQNYDYAVVTAPDSSPVGLLSEPDALAGRCIQTPG